MTPVYFRLWQMLLGWGSVGLIYTLTDHLQGSGQVITPSLIDRQIPFSPHAVWLYLSFFIVVPLGYLLTPLERVIWLSRAMSLTALCAGTVYMLYPTTLAYPPDQGTTLSSSVLTALTQVDSMQNCLPSLHMALMVLAVWAISYCRQRMRTVFFMVWVAAIAFSILQLRRHLFIDVISGGLLALVAGKVIQALQRPGQRVFQEDLQ